MITQSSTNSSKIAMKIYTGTASANECGGEPLTTVDVVQGVCEYSALSGSFFKIQIGNPYGAASSAVAGLVSLAAVAFAVASTASL
jgi:hypothetical protein